MELPELKPVKSSNLKAVGYDEEAQALYIQFPKGNTIWKYTPVTKKDYDLFIGSPSLGSFFHQHIKLNPGITAEKVQ